MTPPADSPAPAPAEARPPAARRARVGSAPDSWGVWFPDDPAQVPWPRFLDELATAGYQWLELGPYGYLPTDPARLNEELARRGLQLSAGTAGGALHQAAAWQDLLAGARQVAALTAAAGAQFLVFLPAMYRDLTTGAALEPATLDPEDWAQLIRHSDQLGQIVAEEYGLRLVFHPHADSHVETQQQTERYLAGTDPQWVSLCLDTGHIAYRHGDSTALLRRFRDRIPYLHLKQIDPVVLAAVDAGNLPFAQAVSRGVTVEPPHGVPPLDTLAATLDAADGASEPVFAIVEQDMYPCDPARPLPIATRTARHLAAAGWGTPGRDRTAPAAQVRETAQ